MGFYPRKVGSPLQSLQIISNSTEAVVQRCSVKKVFLEISQNSQEITCTRVSYRTPLVAASVNNNTSVENEQKGIILEKSETKYDNAKK